MFTGIVECTGKCSEKIEGQEVLTLKVQAKPIADEVKAGDSVSVSGVCLTVSGIEKGVLVFQLVPETLKATTLGQLQVSDRVNLESSLRLGDALGGHFVTGHVDGVGKIVEVSEKEDSWVVRIEAPQELQRFIAKKGSITVDGISLTVQDMNRNLFDVALIPHTLKVTTFSDKSTGSEVNLEVDILARYVEKIVHGDPGESSSPLAEDFLKEQGF